MKISVTVIDYFGRTQDMSFKYLLISCRRIRMLTKRYRLENVEKLYTCKQRTLRFEQ